MKMEGESEGKKTETVGINLEGGGNLREEKRMKGNVGRKVWEKVEGRDTQGEREKVMKET